MAKMKRTLSFQQQQIELPDDDVAMDGFGCTMGAEIPVVMRRNWLVAL